MKERMPSFSSGFNLEAENGAVQKLINQERARVELVLAKSQQVSSESPQTSNELAARVRRLHNLEVAVLRQRVVELEEGSKGLNLSIFEDLFDQYTQAIIALFQRQAKPEPQDIKNLLTGFRTALVSISHYSCDSRISSLQAELETAELRAQQLNLFNQQLSNKLNQCQEGRSQIRVRSPKEGHQQHLSPPAREQERKKQGSAKMQSRSPPQYLSQNNKLQSRSPPQYLSQNKLQSRSPPEHLSQNKLQPRSPPEYLSRAQSRSPPDFLSQPKMQSRNHTDYSGQPKLQRNPTDYLYQGKKQMRSSPDYLNQGSPKMDSRSSPQGAKQQSRGGPPQFSKKVELKRSMNLEQDYSQRKEGPGVAASQALQSGQNSQSQYPLKAEEGRHQEWSRGQSPMSSHFKGGSERRVNQMQMYSRHY